MKTELNKNEKLSTEQEAPPIANVLLSAGWNPVEKELPERNENVLVLRDKPFRQYLLTAFQRDGIFISNETAKELTKVTHWMYLPSCLGDVMPSLHSEPKTKDDILLEILAPLGTEIPDPTGEYADLFAYLYDKISPLLSNEA